MAAVSPRGGARPRLLFCDYLAGDRREGLGDLVNHHQLTGAPCTLVLRTGQYQLLRAEAPQVEVSELRDAMRWRIKDLIAYPPDDAILDVFPLPPQRTGGQEHLVYVAAARRAEIQAQVELLRECGLRTRAGDIPELTLRNLVARLPSDGDGTMVVRLSGHDGVAMIFRREELYLSRDLNVGEAELHDAFADGDPEDFLDLPTAGQNLLDHLVLEVQRSLDYYESHYGLPPPKSLVVTPMERSLSILPRYLGSMLGITASSLDIGELVDGDISLNEEQRSHCVGALGAALRHWEAAP